MYYHSALKFSVFMPCSHPQKAQMALHSEAARGSPVSVIARKSSSGVFASAEKTGVFDGASKTESRFPNLQNKPYL